MILKDPLFVYHSDIFMVRKVVEGICPPNSSIDFLADSGQMLYDVHDDDSRWNVRYFATSREIDRLKRKLFIERQCGVVSEQTELCDDSNIPSTSSTPSKVLDASVLECSQDSIRGVKNLQLHDHDDSGFDVSSRSLLDVPVDTMELIKNLQ